MLFSSAESGERANMQDQDGFAQQASLFDESAKHAAARLIRFGFSSPEALFSEFSPLRNLS